MLTSHDVDRMRPAQKLELMAELANRVERLEEALAAVAVALGAAPAEDAPEAPVAPVKKEQPFLTMAEVAELMRVSKSTVYGMVADGTLPFPVLRVTPRRIVVSRAAIEAVLGPKL